MTQHDIWNFFRIIVLTASVALGLGGSAFAEPVTVNWSAQNEGACLATSSGVPLPAGSLVRLGVFDVPLSEVSRKRDDLEFLEQHFIEIGAEEIGSFGGRITADGWPARLSERYQVHGAFAQSVTFDPGHLALNGAQASVWILNARTAAAATEHAIVSSGDWKIPGHSLSLTQWGVEQVTSDSIFDLFLANRGPEKSSDLGGHLIKLLEIGAGAVTDSEALLLDAFGVEAGSSLRLPIVSFVKSPTGTRPMVSFYRRSGGTTSETGYSAEGLHYAVEISRDLEVWEPNSERLLVTRIVDGEAGFESVSVSLQPTGDGENQSVFMRVRVTRQ